MAQTESDASGGLGSFAKETLGLLTGAIQTVGIPYLAKELNLTQTTDADGNSRYAAAPTKASVQEKARSLLSNPLVLIGGALLVGFIVWKAVK